MDKVEDQKELMQSLEIKLDGGLVKDKKVSVRVLGNILPDFQRSFDKVAILELEGRFRRGESIKKRDRDLADFYIGEFKRGSVILPLYGAVKDKTLQLYKWCIKEPYEKAKKGDQDISQELVARAMEARQKAGEFEERYQKDVVREAQKDKKKFARAAALGDLHHALAPVRSGVGNSLSIDFVRKGIEESFPFDKQQAVRFGRIVYKNYMTQPAIYEGKVIGTRERSVNDGFKYEAEVMSSFSQQKMILYVRTEDQIKDIAKHAYEKEIKFWASPLERYGGFDPYNGSLVYLNMF